MQQTISLMDSSYVWNDWISVGVLMYSCGCIVSGFDGRNGKASSKSINHGVERG